MEEPRHSIVMKLLSPLTYPQKFIFISCLFGFSILVSSYFMIEAQNYSINFVKVELSGLQYEKPLRKLLENIPKYYLTSFHSQEKEETTHADLLSLQAQINSDFKILMAADQEQEKTLSTTSHDFQVREMSNIKPEEIERKWSELSRKPPDSAETAELFQSIMHDLRELMVYVGDTSNLSTDPETDTFYLVRSILVNVPAAQELIPKITLKLQAAQTSKETSEEVHDDIVGMLSLLRAHVNATNEGIEKVFIFEKNLKHDSETQTKLKEPFRLYMTHINEFITSIESYLHAKKEDSNNISTITSLAKRSMDAGFSYWDAAVDQLERLLKGRLDKLVFQQHLSVLITLLGALAGFLVGFLTMREISRPLTNLIRAAKNLSTGDLSARVPVTYKDEVGQVGEAFNQMAESFQGLIGQLQWTGIQLTTSTTEIAATAKQQESTIVEQEATTKEIAATAREISATAKDFAKTMNDVSSRAEQTSSLAASGKAGLARMESIMRQMVDAAGNIASKLAVLNEKAGSITSIITTIAKVADQTNLLSLNAAIEAEKAGEYGRSFAVIAREIRRLADQTANATLDIEKMVNEMVSAVSAGVMGVDKFSEEINTGVKQVSTVGEQLSKIIEQVQSQTSSFEAVNQGMQGQSLGAEQINESINQLSEAAQQTTESIRQFHNAIEQLNNAAQEMQNAVSKIKR